MSFGRLFSLIAGLPNELRSKLCIKKFASSLEKLGLAKVADALTG